MANRYKQDNVIGEEASQWLQAVINHNIIQHLKLSVTIISLFDCVGFNA